MVLPGTVLTVVDNSGVRQVRSFGPGRVHRGRYSQTGHIITSSVMKTFTESLKKGTIVRSCVVNTVKPVTNPSGSSISFSHNHAIIWNQSAQGPLASRVLVPVHHRLRFSPNGSKIVAMASLIL